MRTLVIFSNPDPTSLTASVARTWAQAASEADGDEASVIDLSEAGFNPAYTLEDRRHYNDPSAPMPQDVVPYQEALDKADVIVFISPIYWYTMTAMMKGFFDRVICRGFAYHPEDSTPYRLAGKTVRFEALTGAAEEWYAEGGVGEALELQIVRNTFNKYCGVDDVEIEYVDHTGEDDPALRASQLDETRRRARAALASARG
ncbi:NAD(P)H-dependent oxidoreductase [Pseudoscardovia radai]|uniref:NAD(P)H-dependent oxidoreductase n=1 Tax=Pseudoscardovia radai TaxID=987066 RepID=UPI003992C638